MLSTSTTAPLAKSFCVVGISQGDYIPYAKNACTPIADPYASLTAPADGPCITAKDLRGYLGSTSSGGGKSDTFGADAELMPGTYCNGMKISGVNVTFLPGIYIVKDKPLEFSKGSQATGVGVTFILKGKATLEIKTNSQVNLRATASGIYGGLVFFQTPDLAKVGKAPKYPTAISNIKSGGGLTIIGTAYFPSQKLVITSDSPVQSKSPATSLIAYQLEFGGKINTQIRVDHEAGGIPPLLPRSDEGARLVR